MVIDPPWGGPQYSNKTVIRDLPLGKMALADLVLTLRSHCDLVALRLPLNYDVNALAQLVVLASPPPSFSETPFSLINTRVSSPASSLHEDWVKLSPARPHREDRDGGAAAMTSTHLSSSGQPERGDCVTEGRVMFPMSIRAGDASLSSSSFSMHSSSAEPGHVGHATSVSNVTYLEACTPQERPLPFRIMLDVSQFLIVCFPPRRESRLHFGLHMLDRVIARLNAWNIGHGRQHHPAFFDWEKQRWIPLSRWRGCRESTGRGVGECVVNVNLNEAEEEERLGQEVERAKYVGGEEGEEEEEGVDNNEELEVTLGADDEEEEEDDD